MKTILVTGGLGFIGSHTTCLLLNKGYNVIIIDNCSNSDTKVIDNIKKITKKIPIFYKIDIRNYKKLHLLFKTRSLFSSKCDIDAVIHFAGLKSVNESIKNPSLYYENNVIGTLNLLKVMKIFNVKNFIFSSSATVYSQDNEMPITEESKTGPINPYGHSKLMVEKICKSFYNSNNSWNFVMLRYFNPIGAHPSGLLGENPKGIPNNLMPYILRVMNKQLPLLNVFGSDYDTNDGTGIRDYIHVMDLAEGHLSSLCFLGKGCYEIFNLGTGKGYSVLDIVKMMKKVSKKDFPYKLTDRRNGDVPIIFSDSSKAKKLLKWETKLEIEDMCRDSWKFIE